MLLMGVRYVIFFDVVKSYESSQYLYGNFTLKNNSMFEHWINEIFAIFEFEI